MRTLGMIAGILLVTAAHAAGPSPHTVDLNRPGALDRLKVERPNHFEAISEVIRVVEHVPCAAGEVQSLKVRFDIRDLACNFLLMTSIPPKRRLSFSLEDTHYVAIVELKDSLGKLVPASNAVAASARHAKVESVR